MFTGRRGRIRCPATKTERLYDAGTCQQSADGLNYLTIFPITERQVGGVSTSLNAIDQLFNLKDLCSAGILTEEEVQARARRQAHPESSEPVRSRALETIGAGRHQQSAGLAAFE